MQKYLVGICTYNEGQKIRRVIRKFNDYECYDVLLVDDGCTDGCLDEVVESESLKIIRNKKNLGAGHGVRQIISYARECGYEAVMFVAGNNKDQPEDIYKLTRAIESGCDFVQGSRFLPGGQFIGDVPLYRVLATRLYPFLFSMIVGRKLTDATNGFRAIRLSLLDDERINLEQDWLNRYELEPYVLYKAITLGYQFEEVPVTKNYPHKKHGYTKMKPFIGWWSILRPIIYLGLGFKK